MTSKASSARVDARFAELATHSPPSRARRLLAVALEPLVLLAWGLYYLWPLLALAALVWFA